MAVTARIAGRFLVKADTVLRVGRGILLNLETHEWKRKTETGVECIGLRELGARLS